MYRFLAKHQITQVTQFPYSPDLVLYDFWLFPKLKSPLKGKRLQIINDIQENMTGQLMMIGRTVWGPKVPTLKGAEASLSYAQCSFSFFSLFLKIFYLFIFKDRGREEEREGEKHQQVVASCTPLPGDQARNPGMCTDWESNWQPIGSQARAQATELHQPGPKFLSPSLFPSLPLSKNK